MIAFLLLLAALFVAFCGGVALYFTADWVDVCRLRASAFGLVALLLFAFSLWCGLTALARIFGGGQC